MKETSIKKVRHNYERDTRLMYGQARAVLLRQNDCHFFDACNALPYLIFSRLYYFLVASRQKNSMCAEKGYYLKKK